MNDNDLNSTESLVEILRLQADVLLAMVVRPFVQLQIVVFGLIVVFSWLLPKGIRRWRSQRGAVDRYSNIENTALQSRWLRALYQLLAPLAALVLLNIAILLLVQLGIPNGLLRDFTNLIWTWLIYRALLTFLEATFGSEASLYRNRIVTPVFLLLVVWQFVGILPGSVTLYEAVLQVGKISIVFGPLLVALVVLYFFFVLAWIIEIIMVRNLPGRYGMQQGLVQSVSTLTRYALLTLGVIISLGLVGLDFTSLAIIAGGLSVGIGIGLQDIVSNFVSGLALLFEQSLRPGDIIELDGRITQVEKISLRATIVRTRTNEELIIPNANFTTQQVKNFTKSDRLVQVIVPLGVSYDSDPEIVRELAIETSLKHPQVLANPAPNLIFISYGESSIDFSLLVSTIEPEFSLRIRSDLYYMLWKVFADNNITIPFPQRDLNLGTGWNQLVMSGDNRGKPNDE